MERFVLKPFRNLKKVLADSVESLRENFQPLPEFEEAVKGFSHRAGCSQFYPIQVVKRKVHIPGGGGFDFGITVDSQYLVCNECEASQEFQGEIGNSQRGEPEVLD